MVYFINFSLDPEITESQYYKMAEVGSGASEDRLLQT